MQRCKNGRRRRKKSLMANLSRCKSKALLSLSRCLSRPSWLFVIYTKKETQTAIERAICKARPRPSARKRIIYGGSVSHMENTKVACLTGLSHVMGTLQKRELGDTLVHGNQWRHEGEGPLSLSWRGP